MPIPYPNYSEATTPVRSTAPIKGFFNQYRFLSNFFYTSIMYEGELYATVEHAYQSAKTLIPAERPAVNYHTTETAFEGTVHRHTRPTTPGEAKAAGKKLTLRPDWDDVKYDIMLDLLRIKFADKELASHLLSTGDAHLEETNTWNDFVWGVCRGRGQNWLGQLLMQVRHELSPQ